MRLTMALLALVLSSGSAVAPHTATTQLAIMPRSCPQIGCWWVEDPGSGGTDDSVTVGGTEIPEPDLPPDDIADTGEGDGSDDSDENTTPAPPGPGDRCWDTMSPTMCPNPPRPEPEQKPDYPDTISNTDLIRFTPPSPTATAENAGFTLTTTPMTITATATPQDQTGVLLGHPVTVAFTPASTTIDFGDTTTTTDTNTNTVFTHTYTTRGTYTATLTTQYTATVTFADGVPRSVTGTVRSPTTALTLRVLAARTSLTHTPCTTTPHPPHC